MAVNSMVPLLNVTDLSASTDFYVRGLGFEMVNEWRVEGELRWCRLELDGAGMMLQQHPGDSGKQEKDEGVYFCIFCEDAVAYYHQFCERQVDTREPVVSNALWVTSVTDPDGYRIDFESPTDTSEGTRLSQITTS